MTHTLILLRHGQSDWNEKNLFTGWVDVPLTDLGRAEAKRAGELLTESGLLPDIHRRLAVQFGCQLRRQHRALGVGLSLPGRDNAGRERVQHSYNAYRKNSQGNYSLQKGHTSVAGKRPSAAR